MAQPRLVENMISARACQYICMYNVLAHSAQIVLIDTTDSKAGKSALVGMAERVGFEPTVAFPLHSLSRRALSTAQTPLRGWSVLSLTKAHYPNNLGYRACPHEAQEVFSPFRT